MVSEEKKKVVKEVSGFVEKYPVIGIVNMHKLPARQLGEMKEKLRGKAVIRVTKKSLMSIALESSKAKSLLPSLEGQPAFLFSESDPFELSFPRMRRVGRVYWECRNTFCDFRSH